MSYKRIAPLPVPEGGTGIITGTTAYAPIFAGTTATGAFQTSATGMSNAGWVLTSTGSASLPTWQAVPGGGGSIATIAGDSGTATGGTVTLAGTAHQITTAAAGSTVTFTLSSTLIAPGSVTVTSSFTVSAGTITLTPLNASGIVLNSAGGVLSTAATTNHAVQIGNASGQLTSVAVGTSGQLFQSAGAADPGWTTSTYPSTNAQGDLIYGSGANALSTLAKNASATRYLANTGAANSPAWDQINMANGVTGTLTVPNGGTGAGSLTGILTGNGTSAITATAVTQHDVLVGGASNAITSVAPTATQGVPLVSQGASADPAFGTASVPGGGSGNTSFTPYTLITAGTTATGALQNVASVGSANQVLVSNGAAALPSWSNVSALAVTSVNGTANQIASSNPGAGSTTLSIPSTFIAPGSIEATTSIKADTVFNTPTTSSTVGQYQINGTAVMHSYGTNNFYLGASSGNFTQTGTGLNVGIGASALNATTTGNNNTCIGYNSGLLVTTGHQNTMLGTITGNALTTGSRNVLIGWEAGSNYTGSESDNIILADGNGGITGESNTIRIGHGTGGGSSQQNQCFIAGIQGITVTGTAVLISNGDQLGIAVSSRRFKENVVAMDDYSEGIYDLKPVLFNYKKGDKTQQSGLIAEDVAEVMPHLVVHDKEGLPQSVKYHDLPALLLNEIKKLKKQVDFLLDQILEKDR